MMKKQTQYFNQEISNASHNTDSFELLYEDFFTPLFKYVMFRLHDRNMAMDIVQTVFTKAFQHHEHINQDKALHYLYTMARNQIIDHYRKKQPVALRDPDEFMASVTDDYMPHPEQYAIQNESFHSVHALIESLPELERDVIILRYIQELEYSEIALILNKNESAIRQAVSRAIRSLREEHIHQTYET